MAIISAEEDRKQLEVLKTSYEMYEESKKKTEKRMKSALNADGIKKFTDEDIKKEMDLIEDAEKEIFQKYAMFGGDPEELKKKSVTKKKTKKSDNSVMDDLLANAEQINKEREEKRAKEVSETATVIEREYAPKTVETQTAYDVIPLPSNGECYKQKLGRIPVAYLTAYDENMIIAPNLYRDKKIIDLMLKEKILNNTIDPADLLEGDRDAIILFLRASGYGNEYPITATDNITGEEFDTVIDLTKLKYKEFKLTGDENGWFPFELPICKKTVKFKFLTHRDNTRLETIEKIEDSRLKKEKIKEMVGMLDEFIENDEDVEKAMKTKVRQSIRTIEDWEDNMDEEEALEYTHSVTNRLELAIMEVDGVTDRKYIRDFVRNMNVRDSSALRRYMTANEPGIDYNITVEKPESLGGGSMTVFLQLDQYIFLNIA